MLPTFISDCQFISNFGGYGNEAGVGAGGAVYLASSETHFARAANSLNAHNFSPCSFLSIVLATIKSPENLIAMLMIMTELSIPPY
jgi:hypothetical protein